MKILFMGTPDFAVPCLEVCHQFGEVVGVVTQPDRPKGRGKKLTPPPVKEKAEALGLPILQPEKVKTIEATQAIEALKPDLIIVVAYGQLLSQRILDIPQYGCINVHASLLPKLRGASPINWSIVSGETETGVTTMYMSLGLDEGDMIHKMAIPIEATTTAGELHDQLMALGGEVLKMTLAAIAEQNCPRTPQGDVSTYAPILKKEMGKIDWQKDAQAISALIRGFDPWPVAYTTYEEVVMKLYEPVVVSLESQKAPGTILKADKEGMLVQTGKDAILIKSIQMPNGKRLPVSSYILGHALAVGTKLV